MSKVLKFYLDHNYRIFILFCIAFLIVSSAASHKVFRGFYLPYDHSNNYDDSTHQLPVLSHNILDSILNTLPIVKYDNLPNDYLVYSHSEAQKDVLKYREFYKLSGSEIYKFVVGHFRISELMSKDSFYESNITCLPGGCDQYWLTDAKLLHKFLDLVLWMRKSGYNDSAISINNGHRHPFYNELKGGVSRSYHMQGLAIDLKVGDINRNGIADAQDKQILLDVLETEIIKNEGGLGKYPHSDVIHFDTRGYRARWDKQ